MRGSGAPWRATDSASPRFFPGFRSRDSRHPCCRGPSAVLQPALSLARPGLPGRRRGQRGCRTEMSSPWSGKGLLRVASVFVPALLLGLLAWRHRWVADDGFIGFRVVDNLLLGSGPVFHPGERVEAFTSPAWVALLAFGGLIVERLGGGLPLEWISVACGIACGVA